MTIFPKRYQLSIPSLSLKNADLVHTDSIKHTGVVLTNYFIDDGDMSRLCRCLCGRSYTIMPKFPNCLYLYCSAPWRDYSMSSISKLRVAYNNVFRNLLGYGRRDSTRSIFAINTIDTYEVQMR